ncbi:MAG TPA: UDP-glucuronic acid decarboxylase family protein [Thermoplasmata archaeon]|nr:UDP-glucuronic acid decarboxylase family protein [Thermoplasmata archaeon]
MDNAIVTGAAGFLGSHLCDRLLAEGYQVTGVDNLISGSPTNLRALETNDAFTFLEHDITKPLDIPGSVDSILHLASPASPEDYLRYPIQTLKAGALGTHVTLGLAKAKGARYLLASTSEVYGDPAVNPQPEEYWGNVNPIGPRGVYDEAKRYAEAMTMAYHRVHDVDTRIARIFNTYGPRQRMDDGRAIPTFIRQALSGHPLTVHGDGKQTRSFCYVDDMTEGLWRLLRSGFHEPVNLGNPQEITILELAEKVRELVGRDLDIVFKDLPKDDPKVRCPDIARAKKVLAWEPTVDLDTGLKRTIAFFRGNASG